jgi:hypothetical protein
MKAALLLCAVAAGVGCADNNSSLAILQMQAITSGTMCQAQAAAGGASLSRGTLDVTLVTTQGYIAAPVVRNNLAASMTLGSGMFEYNAITLTGANVSLQTPAGAALSLPTGQQSFFYPASGIRLDPGQTGAMFVEVLRADVAKSFAGMIPAGGVFTIVANVRPVGDKGGQQVIGEEMPFPIDLCSGCLIGTVNPCPLPKGTPTPMDVCFPQQDFKSTCCSNSGQLLCGPQAPIATM